MLRLAVHLISSNDKNIHIFVDNENAREILDYFNRDNRHKKKFEFIIETLLRGFVNHEIYDREYFEKGTENITAIKLFKGQENDRIYCQDYLVDDKRIIVLSELHLKKKTNKLSSIEKSIIRRVSKYQYELEDRRNTSSV